MPFFLLSPYSQSGLPISEWQLEVIEPIINHILGDIKTQSELERNVNLLSQVNPDPFILIKLILNFYGKTISLGILALLCIGLILISIKNHRIKPDFYRGFSVMGYIVLLVLSIALLVSNGSFGFGRVYAFASLVFSADYSDGSLSLFI